MPMLVCIVFNHHQLSLSALTRICNGSNVYKLPICKCVLVKILLQSATGGEELHGVPLIPGKASSTCELLCVCVCSPGGVRLCWRRGDVEVLQGTAAPPGRCT